jgi:hypothetical protein
MQNNEIIPRPRNDTLLDTRPSYFKIGSFYSGNNFSSSGKRMSSSLSQIVVYLRQLERLCESRTTTTLSGFGQQSTICTTNLPMKQAFKQPTLVCKRLPVIHFSISCLTSNFRNVYKYRLVGMQQTICVHLSCN